MMRRLFIANRGEIAVRIIRTAQRMGITCILGCSAADQTSLAAKLADELAPVGPAPSSHSYLSIERVIAAARRARADAIHPGYGFLSENAAFAQAAVVAELKFVGPDVASLRAVGDKLMARTVARDAGLPVVPGGAAANRSDAVARARETGYPLLLKAVAGGGGRGMRRVDNPEQLDRQLDLAMSEALSAFGDARVYVERYIARGRHIEVQVLGDGSRVVHLGTRDCSIQRRFQKLLEEAPAPNLPDETRDALQTAAVRLASRLGYRGVGTVEFLVDADTFEFYFLEMNARIQVEHPVTEEITGIDLIEQQLLIAEGQPLGLRQDLIAVDGHAIEVRINAEDWQSEFRPSPGKVIRAAWPVGRRVRIDTHIACGEVVPPFYDSLLAKVIVSGVDRSDAVRRLRDALEALAIHGVTNTVGLQRRIVSDPRFVAGEVTTRFFEGWQQHG